MPFSRSCWLGLSAPLATGARASVIGTRTAAQRPAMRVVTRHSSWIPLHAQCASHGSHDEEVRTRGEIPNSSQINVDGLSLGMDPVCEKGKRPVEPETLTTVQPL